MKKVACKSFVFIFALLLVIGTVVPPTMAADVNWIEGGKAVDVGDDFASFDIPQDQLFLNKDDTIKLEKESGNTPTMKELGSIFPKNDADHWFVVLEYDEVGYIKDDEKDDIDADEILQSYKDGTEEENKERKPEDQIHVVGWDVEPFYDSATHTLQWSMLAEDAQKQPLINYNVRVLSRKGYVSFILVSDPSRLAQDKKMLTETIMPKFTLKTGNRYEDFNESTDEIAEYGLTGLVLGGLGLAVAKKVGLLALLFVFLKKGWIIIVIAVGAIARFMKRKPKKTDQQPVEDAVAAPPADKDANLQG